MAEPTESTEPKSELRLLGAPQFIHEGRAVAVGSRKAMALLAYVAIEGRTARGTLATLLWSELDAASARRNLRRELHRLREAGIESALVGAGDALELAPTLAVDLQRFERAVAAGDAAGALAAYRGALLDGFDLSGADPFDHWARSVRERCAQRFRGVVLAHAAACERDGRLREALQCHLRLIADDNLQERHFQDAMRLHGQLGEREAALALFERCRVALGRELGLRPLAETVSLAEEIRRGIVPAAAASAPPARRRAGDRSDDEAAAAAVDWPSAVPFAGRDELLQRVIGEVRGGRVVWLTGEPGVGKSRLAREAAARFGEPWIVQARPGDAQTAYATLTRLLQRLLDDAAVQALPAWVRRELARVLPALGAAGMPLRSAADRLCFHAAVDEAVRRVLPAGVQAIVFDDWHEADAATLAWWTQSLGGVLAPAGRPARALLVTAREAEMPPPLRERLRAEVEEGRAAALTVPPLSAEALLRLVQGLVGSGAGGRFAARLHRATAGNPFFVLETLRHLAELGHLRRRHGGGWETHFDGAAALNADDLPIPPSVREAALARLARLDEPTRRLLESAALHGDPFEAFELAEAAALSEAEVVGAVEQAMAAGVLASDESGVLSFAHDLIAQALAAGLSAQRRKLLHRQLARALERIEAPPARIARHLEAAGARRQALPWRWAAARAAESMYAHEEALAQYAAILAAEPPVGDSLRARLARARVLERLDRVSEADAEYALAEAQALHAGDAAGMAMVQTAKAGCWAVSNRVDAALALTETLLEDAALSPLQAVETLEVRADCLNRIGRPRDADAALRDALARLPAGASLLRGRLLAALGRSAMYRGEFAAAVAPLERAIRVYTITGAMEPLSGATVLRGALEMNLGRTANAIELLERGRALAAQAGSIPQQRSAILNLVKVLTQTGDVNRALALIEAGERLSPHYENPTAEGAFLQSRYYCQYLLGELGAALDTARRVVDAADRLQEVYWPVGARQLVVDLYLLLGDFAAAAGLLVRARALCADESVGYQTPLIEVKTAWLELLRGEPQAALDRLSTLGPVEAMPMPEAADLRRHVEAAARLAVGDAAGAAALLADPAAAATSEAQALQWAARLAAEAALGAPVGTTIDRASAALAEPGRLPAFEAMLLRRALAQAAGAAGRADAGALAEQADRDCVRLAATLAGRPALRDRLLERYPPLAAVGA